MNATERLRALLDERGVEWRERVWGGKHSVTTFWHARGVRWHYRENRFGELRLHADGLAPEQAIDATLGRGTCHETVIDHYWRGCGSCGYIWEFMYGIGKCERPRYCPNCGRKVVE